MHRSQVIYLDLLLILSPPLPLLLQVAHLHLVIFLPNQVAIPPRQGAIHRLLLPLQGVIHHLLKAALLQQEALHLLQVHQLLMLHPQPQLTRQLLAFHFLPLRVLQQYQEEVLKLVPLAMAPIHQDNLQHQLENLILHMAHFWFALK